ncbi:MAG: hypothetical protein IKN69_03145 [Bacilli bacterium]|nr:hypothetical protein [Bacilli bacterium]
MRYEVGITFLALILGYMAFSFVYASLSHNTWIGKGVTGAAKVFYAIPISRVFKSQNGVLYMATVKVMVASSIAAFSSVIFIPFCIVMAIFSMFGWGVSARLLKEELASLKASLV